MTEPPRPPGEGNNDPTAPYVPPYVPPSDAVPPPSSPPPPPPPGGYAPPPPGGYNAPPQQFGYGYPPPPDGGSAQEDRTWILVAHFGGAAGAFVAGALCGWIAPLVAMLARGNQSPVVRAEAVKALNFHILWSIVALIGLATTCIGIGVIVWAAAWIVSIIFGVIAGIKAANGEPYNYPMSVQIIK